MLTIRESWFESKHSRTKNGDVQGQEKIKVLATVESKCCIQALDGWMMDDACTLMPTLSLQIQI